MNKIIKRFFYIASLFAIVASTGCKDELADEITDLNFNRLLSPTELDVRVVNQTSIRLAWKQVKYATSYTVEFFENAELDFSGTPIEVVEGVSFGQLPLVVPGFAGETTYSLRVKAVGSGIADSKWTEATITTATEQIFFPVNPDDITESSVILRWPEGEVATHIVLNPGEINHVVTQGEVDAGAAEITGLADDTEYTALLMNGTKQRGSVTFKTNIDTGGAIIVNPTDNLTAIVEAAEEGALFALNPGTYTIEGNIFIYNTVSLVSAVPGNKPIIVGASFRMRGGSGLMLKDLELVGTGAPDGNQTIVYDEVIGAGEVYGDVLVEDCIIRNFTKGIIYVNIAVLIESVTYKGNIIHSIECNGGDFIDFRQGMARNFDFINNTVYNSAADRDIFRMDGVGSTNFPGETTILYIGNNTFYNIVTLPATTRRILYIRLASHEITVSKNIFAETLANYSNQSLTLPVTFNSNNYHNAPKLYDNTFTVHDAGNYTTYNPGFVNPATGDFTVTNEDLIFTGIGDPRWLQ